MKFLSDLRLVSANTVLKELFGDEDHDFCVSQSSATGDFSYVCTDRKDWWKYNHLNICKQDDIGEKILLLLKYGKSDFKTFGSSLSSVNAAPIPKAEDINSAADTSDCTIENPFTITVTPEVLNVHDTGKVKIKAVSNVDIDKQLYMSISMNGIDTIFAAASKDTKTFEVSVEFTSQDTGLMEVSCLSYNTDDTDKIKFYISDTAHVLVAADLDNVNITSIDFAADSVYTSVNSETPAGLYAVDSDRRYCDVSSPLCGTQWTSTEIAHVNDNGCIEGLKEGKTTLTAAFRGFTASVNVEVSGSGAEKNISISGSLSNGIIKKSYSKTLKVTGGVSPYTWTKSSGTLPAGLKLGKTTGKISGTPTKAGKFTFKIKAADSNGAAVTKSFTVNITAPEINGELADGVIKAQYTGTLTASGGTSPYTWNISEGALPAGLTINESTGEISGKPSESGTFTFTVKAADKNRAETVKEFTVKITKPSISGTLKAGTVGKSYSKTLKASGGTPSYTWKKASGTLPSGLKLGKTTGKISGIPTEAGKFTFKIKVTDANGAAAAKSYTVTIKAASSSSANAYSESLNETENDDENVITEEKEAEKEAKALSLTGQTETHSMNSEAETHLNFAAELQVISDDVISHGTERDEDLLIVRANQPLRFIIGTWPRKIISESVCVDDEPVEEIEITAGKFTLPAEMIHHDFKISVKANTGDSELESQELYISAE